MTSTPDEASTTEADTTESSPTEARATGSTATATSRTATPAEAPASARRFGAAPLIGMLAAGALVGGIAGGGVVAAVLASAPEVTLTAPSTPTSITINDPDDATLVTGVVATAMPSVVTLQVAGGGVSGSGSGVILSADGYVLTNNHVATLEGASSTPSIRVTLSDGRLFDAELIGSDPIADLAVIKLDGAEGLPAIEFADSDALNVGDRAIVIGAPLGLAGSVTNGIVSALNRSITVRSSAAPEQNGEQPAPQGTDAPFDFWDFNTPGGTDNPDTPAAPAATISLPVIQTDAAINPGNSGGALLNDQGQLIGIVVAIASTGGSAQTGSIGVGFSIPSSFAQRIADELIADGSASHGLLGASVSDSINDPSSTVAGARVESLLAGGAAEKAGLRVGDIITTFNGVPISSSVDLTAQVRVLAGGSATTLSVVRDGAAIEIPVTLGELG